MMVTKWIFCMMGVIVLLKHLIITYRMILINPLQLVLELFFLSPYIYDLTREFLFGSSGSLQNCLGFLGKANRFIVSID